MYYILILKIVIYDLTSISGIVNIDEYKRKWRIPDYNIIHQIDSDGFSLVK